MKYASLFSGCGGADIGLCAAGLNPIWFAENAEKPSDVLRYRYPDVPNYGDITKLDPEAVEVPEVLWMSPPCQDISIAGNQDGLSGERSGLFYEAIRICRTLVRRGTSLVLMEQVPNLRSINGGRDMASVLGSFLDIGARDIGWTLLDTQFAGIPQSRDRIFFAVDFRGERASEILSFASRLCRDASPRRKAGEGTTGTLKSGSNSGGRACSAEEASQLVTVIHDGRGRGDGGNSPTLCTDHAGRPSDQCPVVVQMPTNDPAYPLTAEHKMPRGDGQDNHVVVTHDPAATLHAGCGGTIDRAGSYGVGPVNAVIEDWCGMQVRRLMPIECERLQGFPDNHTRYGKNKKGQVYELADTPRYRMIGNAVSSCWGKELGERVLEASK